MTSTNREKLMRIGIIGAGGIGQTVGRLLAEAGHDVLVSWSSTDARLQLAAEHIGFGARTATPAEAVAHAEAVLFAPRFEHVDAASSWPNPPSGPAQTASSSFSAATTATPRPPQRA